VRRESACFSQHARPYQNIFFLLGRKQLQFTDEALMSFLLLAPIFQQAGFCKGSHYFETKSYG
jgi:hypothetical protein